MDQFEEQIEYTNTQNEFFKHCGIKVTDMKDGYARAEVEVKPFLKNPRGIIQGGLLYTLADGTSGALARCYIGKCKTVDTDFHFYNNVSEGTVYVEITPCHIGHSIARMNAKVKCEDKVLAEGIFSFFKSV